MHRYALKYVYRYLEVCTGTSCLDVLDPRYLRADTDTNLKAKHIMQPSHRPSGSQDDYSVPGSWPTYHEVDHRQPGERRLRFLFLMSPIRRRGDEIL